MEENKVVEIEVKKENVFKRTRNKISKWWNEGGQTKAATVGKIALGILATSAGVLTAAAFAKSLQEKDEENADENTIETEDCTVIDDSSVEE